MSTNFVAIVILIMLAFAAKAYVARRKCGEILFAFEERFINGKVYLLNILLFLIYFGVVAPWIGRSYVLIFIAFFVFWTPYYFLFLRAYLGRNGVKVGYEFISRDRIYHYHYDVIGKRKLVVELAVKNRLNAVQLITRLHRKDEVEKIMKSYFPDVD
ncbi:hypothetical protein D7Z26_02345 [Cohnella endophytica]|uniref:DUF5673 domain-containing protein n=1 Tax=Cohnella endophytica TaxID=2419778 RepID=A0A494Y497_9BACL|nr:hypothetical protein [Cohnella endophytica]RKP56850.1 hypothetical protein D7Z26_02345 [Cohnella endophytica]